MRWSIFLLILVWDNVDFSVAQTACSTLPTYEHAIVSEGYTKAEYRKGDVIYFSCEPGYSTRLNTTVICTEHGWRAATIGQCSEYTDPVPLGCTPPPPIQNGHLSDQPLHFYVHGTRVRYKCNDSYTMTGHRFKTCDNGKWAGDIQCLIRLRWPRLHSTTTAAPPTTADSTTDWYDIWTNWLTENPYVTHTRAFTTEASPTTADSTTAWYDSWTTENPFGRAERLRRLRLMRLRRLRLERLRGLWRTPTAAPPTTADSTRAWFENWLTENPYVIRTWAFTTEAPPTTADSNTAWYDSWTTESPFAFAYRTRMERERAERAERRRLRLKWLRRLRLERLRGLYSTTTAAPTNTADSTTALYNSWF